MTNVFSHTKVGGEVGQFPTTRWSRVVHLSDPTAEEFREAFNDLAVDYWKPVYAYIRAKWGKDNEDAKDLTQEFFSFLMDRNSLKVLNGKQGRFRENLLP